jgi:hypothetical protein
MFVCSVRANDPAAREAELERLRHDEGLTDQDRVVFLLKFARADRTRAV